MSEIGKKVAEAMDRLAKDALFGDCPEPRQTALRVRGRQMETVELDDAGNVIEPPARCCYGVGVHAPNCKFWLTCS